MAITTPVTACLARIFREIPMPILEMAFEPRKHQKSIDQCIVDEVIAKQVLVDANTSAGLPARIPLDQNWLEPMQAASFSTTYAMQTEVYRIPPEARENRDISVVLRVLYANGYEPSYLSALPLGGGVGLNDLSSMASLALRSRTYADSPVMPTPIYHGDNIVQLLPKTYTSGYILDCLLGFDPDFTNLHASAIPALQSLVLAAAQQIIHTRLVLSVDANALFGGQALGRVRELIDEYKDPNGERYKQALTDFQGACLLDPQLLKQLVLLQLTS